MAQEIGNELGKRRCTVITGACSGLPYQVARTASRQGSDVIGFSPVRNIEEQRSFTPHDDLSIYTEIEFTPPSRIFDDLKVAKKYRNVISTSHCDAGIIIAGRWGTLHEFCSLVDYGKVVGVLEGSGLIADELRDLWKKIRKGTGAEVIFESSPEALITSVLNTLESR